MAELADAYGSGPYGATRGGSSPLVSNFLDDLSTFAEYLSTFEKNANQRERAIEAIDIRNALLDYQIPSDEDLQQAFEPAIRRNGQSVCDSNDYAKLEREIYSATPLHIRCIVIAFGSYPT